MLIIPGTLSMSLTIPKLFEIQFSFLYYKQYCLEKFAKLDHFCSYNIVQEWWELRAALKLCTTRDIDTVLEYIFPSYNY